MCREHALISKAPISTDFSHISQSRMITWRPRILHRSCCTVSQAVTSVERPESRDQATGSSASSTQCMSTDEQCIQLDTVFSTEDQLATNSLVLASNDDACRFPLLLRRIYDRRTELNWTAIQFSSVRRLWTPLYTQFTPPELTRQNRWVSSFVASVKAMWIGQLLATCSVFRFVRLECPIYNVRLVRNRVIREPHDAGAYRGVWHHRARAQLINSFVILWLK